MKLEIFDAKNLNFVELNNTGGNDTYIRCDKESKYIDSVVFNLFAPCFEAANKLYEYYGPTKYNARKIIPLRNELIHHSSKLALLESKDAFIEHISSHFLGREFLEALAEMHPNWESKWAEFRDQLVALNNDITVLTEVCADEEKILWVVGY